MELTLASREALEKFAGLSRVEILSVLEGLAGKILNGEYGQAVDRANAVRAEYNLTTGAESKSSQEGIGTEPSDKNSTTKELTFTEIEKSSKVLGPATTGFTGEPLQSPQMTPRKAHLALQEWLSASESRVLWIYGSSSTRKPSDLSSTSAFLVSTIHRAGLPLIAHQCENSGSSMDTLISMVYSMLTQLIWLVPEDFSTSIDLSPDRFSLFDRSVESLLHAMLFIQDLLTLAPRILVVVIDGLQLCEDGLALDNKQGTGMYLGFIRQILENGRDDRVLKTLFTTDGVCDNLWRNLSPQDQLDLMSETGGPAAHRRKGRSIMG